MHRSLALVVVTLLLAAVLASGGIGAASAQAGAERQDVTVRDLRLRTGDVLAVALHPSTTPIELTARRLDVEACPGTWDGEVGTPANTSWPTRDGFTECIPFVDGTAVLPSAGFGGGGMHLVFAVRARAATKRPGVLTIRYEAVDGFFMLTPAAVKPKHRSPSLVITPSTSTIATGLAPSTNRVEQTKLRDVLVTVRQRGRIVRESPSASEAARHAWPAYGPVTPGRPVSIRAVNDGSDPIRFAMGVDVR